MATGKHFVAGAWITPDDSETIPVLDPADGETFAEIARGTAIDVDYAVQAARRAFRGDWGGLSATEKGRLLFRLSTLILGHAEELAALETRDVGKPISQARADVAACARYFEFYAGAADKIHGETIPYLNGYTVMTLREPHGVCGNIIPWNYPLQMIGRSVGGALAAGNACVLKPAEDASLSALRFAQLTVEAGFPDGTFNVVTGYGAEAGAALTAHPDVDHISFTGSPDVGALVQKAAANNVVPVTLELGGKSPQVIFADADLEAALPFLVGSIIQNAGQTCSAGSRLLIQASVYDQVVERIADRFRSLQVGPGDRDLDVGPLINRKQQTRVERYLAQARADQLPILAQGRLAANVPPNGNYVLPTLIGDVSADHPLAQEEIFGPVLVALRFHGEEEAVRLANATPYGLAAGIWTANGGRQMRLARNIKAGQIFVNNYGAGGGVELPFGGMKMSGYGREKGLAALEGFSAIKTVAIKHT